MTTTTCGSGNQTPSQSRNRPSHAEWLMDVGISDSFPASDPASSSQPGSLAYERYALVARSGKDAET